MLKYRKPMRVIALTIAMMMAMTLLPSFSMAEGADEWLETDGWTYNNTAKGVELISAGDDNLLEHTPVQWPENWQIMFDFISGEGEVKLVFSNNNKPQYAVGAQVKGSKVRLRAWKWKSSYWDVISQIDKAEEFKTDGALTLKVCYFEGEEQIHVILYQDGYEISRLNATGITLRTIKLAKTVNLCTSSNTIISEFSIGQAQKEETPMESLLRSMERDQDGFYLAIAKQAVDDVIRNWWIGDTQTGKIQPTWFGYTGDLVDWRGATWETAMLVFEIYDMWAITQDEYYHEYLKAEAKFFRENFAEEELENAGGMFLWANDDTGWAAMLLLCLYEATGDYWFVERVIGLLDNGYALWYDPVLGGLRYRDIYHHMSLCEVGMTLSWVKLYEITGEQRFYDLAWESYNRLHNKMIRDDNLYFMDASAYWPIGSKDLIEEAASSSFLGGNMCMAALSVWFYHATGNEEYLKRAYATTDGMLKRYNRDGILLNDRDAWCNATFAAFYVSEVLKLPGTEEMQELIKNTAISIALNDRTEDGYYGGSWQGPAEGNESAWHRIGSVARQSMTTGNTVLMITAAAVLESGITHYSR